MAKPFSKILKQLVSTRGVSLSTISRATGIPSSTLSEWMSERSQRSPRLGEDLVRLARFLGVSIEYLATGKEVEQTVAEEVFGVGQAREEYVTIHSGIYRVKVEKVIRELGNRGKRCDNQQEEPID